MKKVVCSILLGIGVVMIAAPNYTISSKFSSYMIAEMIQPMCKGVASGGIKVSPDNKMIMTGRSYFEVAIWDVQSTTIIHTISTDGKTEFADFAFSPDGRYIVVSNRVGGTTLYERSTGKILQTFNLPTKSDQALDPDISVLFAPNGKYIATTLFGSVDLWESTTGQKLQSFQAYSVRPLHISPDSRHILIHAEDNGWQIIVFDTETGKASRVFPGTWFAAYSPDNKFMVTEGTQGLILHDAITYEPLHILDKAGYYIRIDFSSDSKYVLGENDRGTIPIWDVQTGKLVNELGSEKIPLDYGMFVPGTHLLIGMNAIKRATVGHQSLQLWDPLNGKEIRQFSSGTKYFEEYTISPDGTYLISKTQDGTLEMWSIATGEKLATLCSSS